MTPGVLFFFINLLDRVVLRLYAKFKLSRLPGSGRNQMKPCLVVVVWWWCGGGVVVWLFFR
jgi:hypothetical protein